LKDKTFEREDVKVNHHNKTLDLTIYHSHTLKVHQLRYIILYMHGNSSSKLEGTSLLRVLPEGISLASFDFMGCGKN
jgi:hypothetical protein